MSAIKSFADATDYLSSLVPTQLTRDGHGEPPSLARMHALLDLLDNPHSKYPTIHIGGTAGKGSTATILATMLAAGGYTTGLHVTPHLQDIRERMQINGQLADDESFTKLVASIVPAVEQVTKTHGQATYFEVTLALAFLYFAQNRVDIAVIEVGLGGTFDGTNVITPLVSILTNVELDHTEILGDTVEQIARDKVGIFKPSVPVISGVSQPSVKQIVEVKAEELGNPLQLLNRDYSYKVHALKQDHTESTLNLPHKTIDITLHASGAHQAGNAALAIAALEQTKAQGFAVTDQTIAQALATITIPGRFEIVHHKPTVILDGAHNPAKMQALVETLKAIYPDTKITFVLAFKKGKNIVDMLARIAPLASHYYITTFQQNTDFGSQQSTDPGDIAALITGKSTIQPNASQALSQAVNEAKPTDIICVTGSLYLVGELRSGIK